MGKKARRKTPGYKLKQARGSVITAYLLSPSDRSCLPTKVLIDPDDDCYAKIDYHTAAEVVSDLQGEIVIVNRQSMMILDIMVNGRHQRNVYITVAPLKQYEMILGKRWLEDSHGRLDNADLIWVDYEEEKLAHQSLVEERSEDNCLHVELEELRKNNLAMTDDERVQKLHELEVSEIEFLEQSAPLPSYEDNFGEIRDESQQIDDLILQLCELEDSDQGIIVTAFPSPEPEEDLSACQDIYESDTLPLELAIPFHESHEDLEVNENRILELSDEVYNKSFSSRVGEDEEDFPDGQDFYRSRVPITNDHQCLSLVVRLPKMDNFRLFRLISSFASGTPVAPMATSKEGWVAADEDTVARPTVQFPGYRHEEKDPDEEDLNLEDIPVIDAAIGALLSLDTNDHDESRKSHIEDSVTVTPSPKTYKDFSFCKDLTDELLEGLCKKVTGQKNVPAAATLPPEIYKEDLLACQEEFYSPRYIRPLLRPPSRDNRPHRLDGQLLVRDPKPPMIISKEDWINVDKAVEASPTVQFRRHGNEENLHASLESDEQMDELNEDFCRYRTPITGDQCIRPLVRFCLPESGPRFFKPNSISSPARTPEAPVVATRDIWLTISEKATVRLPRYRHHEEKVSQKDDGRSSDSENVPKDLILGESPRVVGLNDWYLETTDVVDSSGCDREVKALIEAANQPPNRPIDAHSFCMEYQLSNWTKIPDTTNNFQRWNNESAVVSDAGGEPTAKRERDPRLWTLFFDVFLDPAYRSAWLDTGQPFRLTMPSVDKSKDEPLLLPYYWHTSDTFSGPVNHFVKSDQIGRQEKIFMKLSTSYCAHNWSLWLLRIISPDGLIFQPRRMLLLWVFTNCIYQLATWVDCEYSFVGKEVFMKLAISHSISNGHYNDSYKSSPGGCYSTWKGAGLLLSPTMFRNSQIMSSIFLNVAVLLPMATAWYDTGWHLLRLLRNSSCRMHWMLGSC